MLKIIRSGIIWNTTRNNFTEEYFIIEMIPWLLLLFLKIIHHPFIHSLYQWRMNFVRRTSKLLELQKIEVNRPISRREVSPRNIQWIFPTEFSSSIFSLSLFFSLYAICIYPVLVVILQKIDKKLSLLLLYFCLNKNQFC